MAILTPEQKQNYLDADGGICPFCGSDNISGGPFHGETTTAWSEISCKDCNEEWQDVYTLTSVETQDELEAESAKLFSSS